MVPEKAGRVGMRFITGGWSKKYFQVGKADQAIEDCRLRIAD